MPRYIIERELPGAGKLSREDLRGISEKWYRMLCETSPRLQWVQSFVTDDKLYCIYRAANEEIIREHAQRGGFPANSISRVRAVIDPTTAE